MRIIDKNQDFYDYIQYIYNDNTFTFDRRDSYLLSKEEFSGYFWRRSYFDDKNNHFVLLQVCHTFWLFELTIMETAIGGKCTDYKIDLLHTWKNYDSKRELIKLSIVSFGYKLDFKRNCKVSDYVDAVNRNDFKYDHVFNKFVTWKSHKYDYIKQEKHIPILCNIGIANIVDHQEIYNSLEEYFSEEKTESERTDPDGLTENIKIESHGFDTKTSFRNAK